MSDAPFRRILVPIDFADVDNGVPDGAWSTKFDDGQEVAVAVASLQALNLAVSLCGPQTVVELLHAAPSFERVPMHATATLAGMGSVLEQVQREASKRAEDVLRRLAEARAQGTKIELHVEPTRPLDLILHRARTAPADLVVMPTSGRSTVARFFIGSTADRVIRECPCPVLVIPAGKH